MKIYKLDIDASKPIRKVMQMQQNSEGVLSVHVSNDGKYIRNLSCAMYEDGNEISAITDGTYKLAVGETPHTVKITAKSTPIESIEKYIVRYNSGNVTKNISIPKLVLPAGVYRQDEFLPFTEKFGDKSGNMIFTDMFVSQASLSNTNFDTIRVPWVADWLPTQKPYFFKSHQVLPADEPIIASAEISVNMNQVVRLKAPSTTITYGERTYPAVGYYTDYSLEHVIKPSTNAACFAEADIQEPTPEPDPDPEPTVEG